MKMRFFPALALVFNLIEMRESSAQGFTSGSTGLDGPLDVTGNITVTNRPDGVYNYTTVHVRQSMKLTIVRSETNSPVYLLATGNVLIEGTIDISGQPGGPFAGGKGGPGGFDGGMPGIGNPPGGGYGPGGGKPGVNANAANGAGGGAYATPPTFGSAVTNRGTTYGTDLLMPLVGGSGGGGSGGGGNSSLGGDGGGGAILIASNTRIDIPSTGSIRANSPSGQGWAYGSGGAIRLVAPTVAGTNGTLSVSGNGWGGYGRIRIDAGNRSQFSPTLNPSPAQVSGIVSIGGLMAVFPPVNPQLDILSVAGQSIAPGTRSAVTVQLPFGAPTSQSVEVQARDFNQVLLVTVVLIPDSGSPSYYNVVVDNSSANPSLRRSVSVSFPPNVITRVMAWAR